MAEGVVVFVAALQQRGRVGTTPIRALRTQPPLLPFLTAFARCARFGGKV
ncbi:MAG: hypothetical protein JNL70_06885 [Saprospiraceae bacterium]|nr:hypothetical protein [Saprospiraceae bacterium]